MITEGCTELKRLVGLVSECCPGCHARQDWYIAEATGPDGRVHRFRICCRVFKSLVDVRTMPKHLQN